MAHDGALLVRRRCTTSAPDEQGVCPHRPDKKKNTFFNFAKKKIQNVTISVTGVWYSRYNDDRKVWKN